VSGLTVTFNNVIFPATPGGGGLTGFALQTSNVRINASTGGAPQITEALLITYPNAAAPPISTNVATPALNVGYVLPSLGQGLITTAATSTTPFLTSFSTCAGSSLGAVPLVITPNGVVTTGTPSFGVTIKQLVTGAFRTQVGEFGSLIANNNTGVGGAGVAAPSLPTNTGVATQGTQISIALANLPAAATVYVPLSVTGTTTPSTSISVVGGLVTGTEVLTLSGSPAVATSPAAAVGANLVALTPTNGSLTVTYIVSTAGTGTQFLVPVFVTAAANAAPVQTTAVTENVSYAPAAAVTGPTASIPTFAVSTTAPTSTITVTSCTTTILFPYVTNATGFETGLAVANTTTDNLGTTVAKPSVATPINGTCTFNFYGPTVTQPTAVVTPTLGVNTAAAPTIVPVYANTLTAMTGASNFTGYAIASCNFTQAHGFAFITDTTGTFSGAMGYLGVVIPSTRGEATVGGTTNE
jgi:hypothetical protein